MAEFETLDSGQRLVFDSGMQRDVTEGKVNYLLTRDGPMYERWAELLQRGAEKYDERNWMRAQGSAELERFRESALRHFEAWLRGDDDEDHAAAVFFNINGAEYVAERMAAGGTLLSAKQGFERALFYGISFPAFAPDIRYQKPGAATESEQPRVCCGDPADCGCRD